MLDKVPKLFDAAWKRVRRASAFMKVVYLLLLVVVVAALLQLAPFANRLSTMFGHMSTEAQSVVFVAMLAGFIVFAMFGWKQAQGVESVSGELAKTKEELEVARQDAKLANERWDHLLSVESRGKLWQREWVGDRPNFVQKGRRKTHFLTVINLKGGVGKTTLAANLAAVYGSGKEPLRVLLVDIDFQGTLGDMSVDRPLVLLQRQHDGFVGRLLTTPTPDPALLARLTVPMNRVPSAKVILSNDALELDEFQLQARFFVDQKEDPRFRFLTHFHRAEVFEAFDLVIFDCPPRVTTSVVNALFCSDHVLIPTRMDSGSIDAVPRTLKWLQSLGTLCPAVVVGVVASHVRQRGGKSVGADKKSYDELRELVKSGGGGDTLFQAVVPTSPLVTDPKRGIVAATSGGREVFAAVAAELRQRMMK